MIFSKQLKATIMAALFTGTSLATIGIASATSNTVVHSAKRVQAEPKTSPSKVITSATSSKKTHTSTPVASNRQQESHSTASKTVRYSQEPTVRVLLGSRTETLPVSLSSGAKVVGGKKSFSATGDLKVTVSGNTVKVNGRAVGPTAHIKPVGVGGSFLSRRAQGHRSQWGYATH